MHAAQDVADDGAADTEMLAHARFVDMEATEGEGGGDLCLGGAVDTLPGGIALQLLLSQMGVEAEPGLAQVEPDRHPLAGAARHDETAPVESLQQSLVLRGLLTRVPIG